MEFKKNHELAPLTTFGLPAKARLFAEYSSADELLKISRTPEFTENEVLHIGGGSNLLFVKDFDGLVLHSRILGITDYRKDDDTVFVIAGAGVKWTDLVDHCVGKGYAGLENMAGIPGEAGASAVQNVGAYGAEARDVIHHVECFDCRWRKTVVFTNEECRFGYRDSIFKHEGKGRYIVLRVSYRLRVGTEARNLGYRPLQELAGRLGRTPTIAEVRDEVLRVRNEKLPDPAELGSAGSFFKNPVVHRHYYEEMIRPEFGDIPYHEVDGHHIKLAAGWLIEHAGLKGAAVGGARVYDRQCLVIVNTGSATASDVVELAARVEKTVSDRYGVTLRPEVNFIDSTLRVTALGSGTSKGVPEIGCRCRVCRSTDPADKRLRASVLVKTHGLSLLIDASPDFRQQALTHDLRYVDAVLLTHSHYDHVGGIDDLRPFAAHGAVDIYLRKDVDSDLRKRLDYCFRDHLYPGVPKLNLRVIDNHPFYIDGVKITPVEVLHGKLPIYGYRIGGFAYITDAKTISDDELDKLRGLDTLIINALQIEKHFAHLSLDEALDVIRELKPRRAFLTHFNHHIGLNSELLEKLPSDVRPLTDGMTIEVE